MCSNNRDIAATRLDQYSDNNSVTLEVIEFRMMLWKTAHGVLLVIKISGRPVELFIRGYEAVAFAYDFTM